MNIPPGNFSHHKLQWSGNQCDIVTSNKLPRWNLHTIWFGISDISLKSLSYGRHFTSTVLIRTNSNIQRNDWHYSSTPKDVRCFDATHVLLLKTLRFKAIKSLTWTQGISPPEWKVMYDIARKHPAIRGIHSETAEEINNWIRLFTNRWCEMDQSIIFS